MTTPKVIEKTPVEVGDEKDGQEVTEVATIDIEKYAHVEGTKTTVEV